MIDRLISESEAIRAIDTAYWNVGATLEKKFRDEGSDDDFQKWLYDYYPWLQRGRDVCKDAILNVADAPRVLTLDEVRRQGCVSILEDRGKSLEMLNVLYTTSNRFGETIFKVKADNRPCLFVNYINKDTYGKCCRCWSGLPTDEQRLDTPWEI